MNRYFNFEFLGVPSGTLRAGIAPEVGLCGGAVLEIADGNPRDPLAMLAAPTIPHAEQMLNR